MNRRDFLFRSTAGAMGLTILSPVNPIGYLLSPKMPRQLVLRTPVWLKRYEGARASSLVWTRRFRLLMDSAFAGMCAPFWWNLCMHYTIHAYMSLPHSVTVNHHRYVVVTGTMAQCVSNRAMLWVDTHVDREVSVVPRAVLAVIDNGTSGRHIWILDNHIADTGTISDMPRDFRLTMGRWIRSISRFRRLEGGRLQKVIAMDGDVLIQNPNPRSLGIPLSRCEPLLSR